MVLPIKYIIMSIVLAYLGKSDRVRMLNNSMKKVNLGAIVFHKEIKMHFIAELSSKRDHINPFDSIPFYIDEIVQWRAKSNALYAILSK